jgi:putative ABC transport system ATP-binding protein
VPILALENVKKSYLGPDGVVFPVLDIARLELATGDQVGLRGASGCGKTTLLNCIAGIIRPDSGRILVHGQDMAALPEPARDRIRGRSIGYVFQSFNLLQGYTALENVALALELGGGRQTRDQAAQMLQRVGLGDRLHYEPRRLSLGQQQRVAIARALVKRPDLVLADEPTGNLDPVRAAEALDLLREVTTEAGAALLLVSHDPAILARLPKVLDLHEINRVAQPLPDQVPA